MSTHNLELLVSHFFVSEMKSSRNLLQSWLRCELHVIILSQIGSGIRGAEYSEYTELKNASISWKWMHQPHYISRESQTIQNVYLSCVSVCLSLGTFTHYCTDPDVNWRNGRGCRLVVHYWADLQSVHRFHCYDNTVSNVSVSRASVCLSVCPLPHSLTTVWTQM